MYRVSALVGLTVLLAITALSTWDLVPREVTPASAPAGQFSAERAGNLVREIATRPRPVGSTEHDRVRDLLVSRLRELGLQPELSPGIGRMPWDIAGFPTSMGRVTNIVARLPGRDSTGTVYLTAHYDSVQSGPGANDDAVGVATVLENARALLAEPGTRRNDVVVLLTDGEEPGLLGAEAYVHDQHPSLPGVVINHEARGVAGPPLLWRMTSPDGSLAAAVAASSHTSLADSLSTAVAAAQTSSSTDYTAFHEGGLAVLDWAYIGGGAYYHGPLDDPAHVDAATVQRLGDNTLAAAREFGGRDLRDLGDGGNRSYFTVPLFGLVVRPLWVVRVLALAGLAGLGVLLVRARRAGISTRGVLGAGAGGVLAGVLAGVAAYGIWLGLRAIRPEYQAIADPYRPQWYVVAMTLIPIAAGLGWIAALRHRVGDRALVLGGVGAVTLVGAALAATVPTTAHFVVIPATAAVVGLLLAEIVPDAARIPLLTACTVPAAVFLGTGLLPATQLGVAAAATAVVPIVVLLTALALPLVLAVWPRRRSWPMPTVAVIAVLVAAVAGLSTDRVDAEHPAASDLRYLLDADHGTAQWVSRNSADPWTRAYVGGACPDDLPWSDIETCGDAPASTLAPPGVQLLGIDEGAERTVRLRITATRPGSALGVRFRDSDVRSIRVAGRDVSPVPERGIRFVAPPPDGLELVVVAHGPVTTQISEQTWLPDAPPTGYTAPPADWYLVNGSVTAVVTTRRF